MSTIKADTIVASDGTSPVTLTKQSAAKAWNNTNNTGTTINDSFNISGLTDIDTGKQAHNVINSFNSANHVPTFSIDNNIDQEWTWDMTTSKWATAVYTGSAYYDSSVRTVSHGDLA